MLLDDVRSNYINIQIYYSYVEDEYGKRVVVVPNENAKELLKDENRKDEILILSTKWGQLNWEQENKIMNNVNKVDPMTGDIQFDIFQFRDSRIKSCLKEWNLKDDNNEIIPVNDSNINKLPSDIVIALINRYEEAIKVGQDKMGK